MLRHTNQNINLYIFGLFIVNIIQDIFTPISTDEAYYWIWSKHLDFGYFDHPPMVAYLIRLGTYLFSDTTLGVRFVTSLLLALTLKIVWELIPEEKKKHPNAELLFFIVLLSMPMFHIYGFITTPDAPLLFFSALFLLTLKNISQKESLFNILMFGIAAACLIYSKYHGGIVVLLALIFRLDLLKKWSTYVSGIIALLLIAPHIYWLYQNDFITFDYHLFQRKKHSGFTLRYVIHYVIGAFGVLNPALMVLLFVYLRKPRLFITENKFLIQMFVGFLGFFLLYSFRSRVEAHWVTFAIIPMTIIIYNLVISKIHLKKTIKYIGISSIILLVIFRVLIILDLPWKTEFHYQNKDYFERISKLADGKNVVFVNSYKKASKYTFYTGKASFSDNTVNYRKNQYDILKSEDIFNNSEVLLIGKRPHEMFDTIKVSKHEVILHNTIDKFSIFNNLKASFNTDSFYELPKIGKEKLIIYNPYDYPIDLKTHSIKFVLHHNREMTFIPLNVLNVERLEPSKNNLVSVSWQLNTTILPRKYDLQIIMEAKDQLPKVISKKYNIEVGKTPSKNKY